MWGCLNPYSPPRGESLFAEGRHAPSRDREMRDRRNGVLSTLNAPFFPGSLPSPVSFLALCASKSSLWDSAKFGLYFCHLKSKASWWHSWHVTFLFRRLFTHGRKGCDSKPDRPGSSSCSATHKLHWPWKSFVSSVSSSLGLMTDLPHGFVVRIRWNRGNKIHLAHCHST